MPDVYYAHLSSEAAWDESCFRVSRLLQGYAVARKKKHQGHYCHVCGRYRAHEKFSGKGHARHICKDCAREQKAAARQRRREKLAQEQAAHVFKQETDMQPDQPVT